MLAALFDDDKMRTSYEFEREPIDHKDLELKARHRALWSLGNYALVAEEVIPKLGASLVEACPIKADSRILDVACGSGNAALPAAARGASVTAIDLTPSLLEQGRRLSSARGLSITWKEADAEALPFENEAFDVVMSCVGVMFAPNHQRCANELVRVCRRGGTIAMANWTARGFIGEMLSTMKPYAPPAPPGALAPTLWGDEVHLQGLFADKLSNVKVHRKMATVDCFSTPQAFREFFKTNYGPTLAVYRHLAGDVERLAALDSELDELARRHDGGHDETMVMDWEYLLFVAEVAT